MNVKPMDWTIWLRQQRHRAVRIQLGVILGLGFLGIAASLWRWWAAGLGYTLNLPIYIVAYIVVILLAVLPSVRDEWRAWGFIVILYGFGVFSLYSGWLVSGGRQFLLALTVVATVLAKPRAGVITAVASMVTYIAFAVAFGQKWLVLRELPDPTSASPMIIEGIGFAMTIVMTATSQWFFGKALQAANAANQETLQARTLLAERAQELETTNCLLATSIASFHNIVERSVDGVLVMDQQGIVRFANYAAGSFFDRPSDQLIGSSAPFSLTAAQNTLIEILGTSASSQVVEVRVVETEWEGQPAYLALLHDITERRRAEEALRASEQKFRGFIEQSSEGFALIDEGGAVVEWNRAQEQISGLSHTQAIGMALWDIQSEMAVPERRKAGDTGRIKEIILDVVRSGQIPPYLTGTEAEIRHPNGQYAFVQQSLFPIATQKGYRLGAVTRDITERKRIEAALRESEQMLRLIFESAFDGISVYEEFPNEAPRKLLDCNARYAEIAGRSREELLRRGDNLPLQTLLEHYDTDDIDGHPAFRGRFSWHRPDGQENIVEYTAVRTNLQGRNLVIGIDRDITEQVRVIQELRESERKLRLIFENAFDGISIHRESRNGTRVLLDCNERYADMAGRSKADLLAIEDTRRYQTSSETDQDAYAQALWKQEPHHGLFAWERPDGRENMIEYAAVSVPFEEDLLIIGIDRDMTEHIQAAREREALIADLEAKNAELERFVYTVSHDLKSPLITIGGFVGFLGKDALAGDVERVKADMIHINDAIGRMQQLLGELLELSRIGRRMNPPETVAFDEIAREAIAVVHGRIAARGMEVEIAPDLPTVYGDRARLVEVVQNLVDNACKFMGNQTHPRIEIGVRQGGDEPVFFVRDNGIGIKPQYHAKVFDLFEKLDPQSEGTGVGLALVKRIVETHGGKIWIESTGGGMGCTFCFTLSGKTFDVSYGG